MAEKMEIKSVLLDSKESFKSYTTAPEAAQKTEKSEIDGIKDCPYYEKDK